VRHGEQESADSFIEKPMTVPYKIHWAKEALTKPPEIKWLVQDMIGEQSLVLFFGESGSKKTYSLLDLHVCIAAGIEWLGFKVKQSPVLVIDQENGEIRLRRRLYEIMRARGIKKEIPLAYICMPNLNLMKPQDTEHLRTMIEKTEAKAILLDSLVDFIPGGDESSSKDTNLLFTNLHQVTHSRQVDALSVIHHANRKGAYRGSSNIRAQVDVMFEIDSKQKTNVVKFKSEKVRDTDHFEFKAVAHFEKDLFRLTLAGETIESSTTSQYILDSFSRQPCTLKQLEDNAPSGMSGAAIKSALTKLNKDGKTCRVNNGAQGATAIYGHKNGSDCPSELAFLK
jgi:hypothetical protein